MLGLRPGALALARLCLALTYVVDVASISYLAGFGG